MTWVIGGIIPFGYGVGISDVRVTFADGSHSDCLQKIYPIQKFIVAGFAGSVKIGFHLLQDLSNFLKLDQPNHAWIPEWVALNWWRRARLIFSKYPEQEQRLKSSILLLGIHPNHNNGDTPFPKGKVCTFESPNFQPKFADNLEFLSIGSGKYIEIYKEELVQSTKLHDNPTVQGEVGHRGGWGHSIKTNLTHTLIDYPDSTVSNHLHIIIAQRGHLSIGNNDFTTYSKDGVVEFKMPPVAKSYTEFLQFCKNRNFKSALASC